MAFPVEKKVDLAFLGTQWAGAELTFSALTFKETRELAGQNLDNPDKVAENMSFVTKFLGDHFLQGKAWNGTQLVDIKATELEDLPVEVVNKAVEALTGQVSPKS